MFNYKLAKFVMIMLFNFNSGSIIELNAAS